MEFWNPDHTFAVSLDCRKYISFKILAGNKGGNIASRSFETGYGGEGFKWGPAYQRSE
jgi:hypothetical protein